MRVMLVNPRWTFEGSVYFGCREPHLPLELGYSKALLEAEGHEAIVVDGQLENLSNDAIAGRAREFGPDMTVLTTAPSYLFWRCAPPELRVPQETRRAIGEDGGLLVAIGPHASTTPRAALRKLSVDAAVMGECEEVVARLASTPCGDWGEVPSVATRRGGQVIVHGGPAATDLGKLAALRWPEATVRAHTHQHHRFDRPPAAAGAEVEASRGCPYACTFCAKDNFRNGFRRRPLRAVLEEIDGLIAAGAEYVYFIDEIFLPNTELLEALCHRDLNFGVQLRIDNWSKQALDLLGRAGCVSIEAGVESITPEGRSLLAKKCRMSTDQLTDLLIYAKQRVPFVQANLILSDTDDPAAIAGWRRSLAEHGVWANEPVPMFPYPGSPDYTLRWGKPDDAAWERAHSHYLEQFDHFSNIQEERPRPLSALELPYAGL